MMYEVEEGSGYSSVTFFHRKTEGEFSLTVTSVDHDDFMNMHDMMGSGSGVGPLRDRPDHPDRGDMCPATKGDAFF